VNLFNDIEPFEEFYLDTGDGHSLYVELSGKSDGLPVLFLHGGPGAGSNPIYRRYFDPSIYKIIIFDQRGSGKSKPFASCENNTSQKLINDIKVLLDHLAVKKTIIYGGSWGSTLALLYSQAYPETVHSLVLRGIFLCRSNDIKWFYQSGAHEIFPDYWKKFLDGLEDNEKEDILESFHKKIHSNDKNLSQKYCNQWDEWEGNCSSLLPSKEVVDQFNKCAISLAKIESHFFINNCFIKENQILENINLIKNIKCYIVHGRYDVVCPINQAFALHNSYENSEMFVIQDAGHSLLEPGITEKIIKIFKNPNDLNG